MKSTKTRFEGLTPEQTQMFSRICAGEDLRVRKELTPKPVGTLKALLDKGFVERREHKGWYFYCAPLCKHIRWAQWCSQFYGDDDEQT